METLNKLEYSLKVVEALIKVHQESYIRDETALPIGVNWDLEKQSTFFTGLLALRSELTYVRDTLKRL